MKAMILAAGFGKRLLPLTETTPKPLLQVGAKPLLQYHLERLAAVNITEVVVNTCWLAEKIEDYFADGTAFGVNIHWSRETYPLETGGGIAKALPLLGSEPFLLINGDVWTDFPLAALQLDPDAEAHLILVDNPEHHLQGDFTLVSGRVTLGASPQYTFSGISVVRPQLFARYQAEHAEFDSFRWLDVMRPEIKSGLVTGERYTGQWWDVGTVERLTLLDNQLKQASKHDHDGF